MVKYAIAAGIGLIVGAMVLLTPAVHQVSVATALVVMSVFFCESTILDKLEQKK